MKWNVQLPVNDFSGYQFLSADGKNFGLKYNRSHGSLRLKFKDQYGVFLVENEHLLHRKFVLTNVYGSVIATVLKNLWHENAGYITFHQNAHKITYKIDTYSSLLEITDGSITHICELQTIPHPGREVHYMPILIALAWMQNTHAEIIKVEVAA